MIKIYDYSKERYRRLLSYFKSIHINILECYHSKKSNVKTQKVHLEAQILITTHSLEKGMGLENTRVGYGQKKVKQLLQDLERYLEKNYSKTSYAFLEAIKLLEVYIAYQKSNGIDIKELEKKVDLIKGKINGDTLRLLEDYRCGYDLFRKEDILKAEDFNFKDFVSLKHSIRKYKPELIDDATMREAIEIANLAPSACNRQPIKVYCAGSKEAVEGTDRLITGNYGFKGAIPNYAIITSDRAYYLEDEQFQWYVNGGIYLSYFTLALHSMGIGSLIMQWFPFYKTENELKKYYNISQSEAIVAVVGYGYYSDNFKCLCAQRRSAEDTLKIKR